MPKIDYYKKDNRYFAVDWSQKDRTGLFVVGRGGDLTNIKESIYEIRQLSNSVPAVSVPPEWQEAIGMAPVVSPPPTLVLPDPPPPEPCEWEAVRAVSVGYPGQTGDPLVTCFTVLCLIFIFWRLLI